MSASKVFVLCLLVAHFVVLGTMAAVVFRSDIKEWYLRKFRRGNDDG